MSSKKSLTERTSETFSGRIQASFGGKSLKEIAELLGEKPSTFWNWATERTDIPTKVLAKIATATGVSLNWLLTGEGEKYIQQTTPSFDKMIEDKIREIVNQELNKRRGAPSFTISGEMKAEDRKVA